MKCIILAAGYATRLYPLTESFPKPLLPVGEKTILDWLISDLEANADIVEYIIVSNHKFIEQFNSWKKNSFHNEKITVLDDGSICNEDRLGAVKDIEFAISEAGINDDVLVLAGDNLLEFSLGRFVDFFYDKNASCVMCHYEEDVEKLKRTGVATLDEDGKIVKMVEKPQIPESKWAVPPFYVYKKEELELIAQGISEGCPVDAPGNFLSWFSEKCNVYAFKMPGKRYDIGNMESYKKAQEEYRGTE